MKNTNGKFSAVLKSQRTRPQPLEKEVNISNSSIRNYSNTKSRLTDSAARRQNRRSLTNLKSSVSTTSVPILQLKPVEAD